MSVSAVVERWRSARSGSFKQLPHETAANLHFAYRVHTEMCRADHREKEGRQTARLPARSIAPIDRGYGG